MGSSLFSRRVGIPISPRTASGSVRVAPPAHMNQLSIGPYAKPELPAEGGFMLIAEEAPAPKIKGAKQFNYRAHRFNLLEKMNYPKACAIEGAFEALFPAGQNTLTKEGVPEVFLEELLQRRPKSLDRMFPETSKDPSYLSAQRMVRRVLRSPVLKRMLCGDTNFLFNPVSKIIVKLDRDLVDFDARAIGLFLIAQFRGQLVVPNFGRFAHDSHINLISEGRLIASVNFLDELPEKVRKAALLIPDKYPRGASFEDATELAKSMCREPRGTNEYNDFIHGAMS